MWKQGDSSRSRIKPYARQMVLFLADRSPTGWAPLSLRSDNQSREWSRRELGSFLSDRKSIELLLPWLLFGILLNIIWSLQEKDCGVWIALRVSSFWGCRPHVWHQTSGSWISFDRTTDEMRVWPFVFYVLSCSLAILSVPNKVTLSR